MSKSRIAGVAVAIMAMVAVGTSTASAETASARGTGPGPGVARGDGCTGVPDSYLGANFRPACDKHDACYSRNSKTDRLVCDNRFRGDLGKACNAKFGKFNPLRYSCHDMANKYYAGVRALGRPFYKGKGNPA